MLMCLNVLVELAKDCSVISITRYVCRVFHVENEEEGFACY